jgi:hypothetical protein
MSTLAVNTITNSAGGNTAQINGMTPTADSLQGFRNRLINGNMVIDQRNAGASVTNTTGVVYTLDRWNCFGTQASKFTVQQSSTAPTGFVNSMLVTSSSAYSVGASEQFVIGQRIEGTNVADLGFGTASAKTLTLSFWVRSSLTGTFAGAIQNGASNRSYPFSYAISVADTWEQKSVTIAGDTTGTWLTTTGIGLVVWFSVGSGSDFVGTVNTWASANYKTVAGATSVVGTSGATFYITGVQLEAGSVATPFERIDYGRQLIQCQRYFLRAGTGSLGRWGNATSAGVFISFPVEMRATPSISHLANYSIFEVGIATRTATNTTLNTDGTYTTRGTMVNVTSSGATADNFAAPIEANIGVSAEL